MQDVKPAPDVVTLRMSRIAILKRIIAFALQVLSGLKSAKPSFAHLRKRGRLLHWLAIAAYLVRRIGEGALDAPRAPPVRRGRAEDEDRERLVDWERDDDYGLAVRNLENFERYLAMPFGAAVERICKGVGLKPDWQAWATEPWAREELRTRPPSSSPAAPAPSASPSSGGTDREAVAVGMSGSSPTVGKRQTSPPGPSGLPADEGEGGAPPGVAQPPPRNRKTRRALAARARHRARAA